MNEHFIQARDKFGKIRKNAAILGFFILVAGTWIYFLSVSKFPKPEASAPQAVFLTNGQAYFGKLKDVNRNYIKLENVHYLQAPGLQSNEGEEAEKTKRAQLIELGKEVHRPKNYMYIPKRQILFWEDLESDSVIFRTINENYPQF